jgi:tetratricopeptide (TPR) repeat protein
MKPGDGGGAGGGPLGLVGTVGHLLDLRIVGHPLQRDGVPSTIARQPQGEGAVVPGHPHAGMDVEARVGPLEHPLGLVFVKEAAAHGAALLKAGRNAEAEAVYREDLKRFPENGWSLFGLAAALKAQGKTAEAEEVDRRFAKAWSAADVKLTASRF